MILPGFNIQTDHVIEAWVPDLVVVDRNSSRTGDKAKEKIEI